MAKSGKDVDAIDLTETVRQIEKSVETITSAMKRLKKTGINNEVLVLLIQAAAPGRLSKKSIEDTLKGMKNLEKFVFPGGIKGE